MDPTTETSAGNAPQVLSYVRKPEDSLMQMWVAYAILMGLTALIGAAHFNDSLLMSLMAAAIAVTGIVLGFILLYRCWNSIQDGNPRTTPGRAVGFLFIPFFSAYWLYVAFVGLAKDMNTYCRERKIDADANERLALVFVLFAYANVVCKFTERHTDNRIPMLIHIGMFIAGVCCWRQLTVTAIAIVKAKQDRQIQP